MNTRRLAHVLISPVVSEKAFAMGQVSTYTFRCNPESTKVEIRQAVESGFSTDKQPITVVSVRTMRMGGKTRTRSRASRQRIVGRSPKWKKAFVTLAPGQVIENLQPEGV